MDAFTTGILQRIHTTESDLRKARETGDDFLAGEAEVDFVVGEEAGAVGGKGDGDAGVVVGGGCDQALEADGGEEGGADSGGVLVLILVIGLVAAAVWWWYFKR